MIIGKVQRNRHTEIDEKYTPTGPEMVFGVQRGPA